MDSAQRDCRKIPGSKNVQKNLPQQAKKLPRCCAEHQKTRRFQRFRPTFQKLFLESDFFDSLRYAPTGYAGAGVDNAWE